MKTFLLTILAVVTGAITSQIPEYAQQYRQRVEGAVVELRQVVERFDQDAAEYGLSRDEALQRYQSSEDAFLSRRGMSMGDVIARYENLSAHLREMREAGAFERLIVFARSRDNQISRDMMNSYEPAMPLTMEGAAHAGAGFAGGWLLFTLLLTPFTGMGRERRDTYSY